MAVNVSLVAVLLLAPASIGYALSIPDDRYTEFAVLTRDASGDLVSDGYPRNLTRGESVPLVISISNHERTGSAYTVVVRSARMRVDDGTVAAVMESRTLSSKRVTVPPGESMTVPYRLTPTVTGEHVRVSFHLYRGDPPPDPTEANAYRSLHLWMHVSSDSGSDGAEGSG